MPKIGWSLEGLLSRSITGKYQSTAAVKAYVIRDYSSSAMARPKNLLAGRSRRPRFSDI
jgi:hypothetical protein